RLSVVMLRGSSKTIQGAGSECEGEGEPVALDRRLVRLKSRRSDFVWRDEADALWRGNRRWQRPEHRRATVIDLPTNQHGVIFVHGVMAVLHVHAAPIAELHGESHATAGMQTIDILAASLPCGDIGSAAV